MGVLQRSGCRVEEAPEVQSAECRCRVEWRMWVRYRSVVAAQILTDRRRTRHTCVHACIHASIHPSMNPSIHTSIHPCARPPTDARAPTRANLATVGCNPSNRILESTHGASLKWWCQPCKRIQGAYDGGDRAGHVSGGLGSLSSYVCRGRECGRLSTPNSVGGKCQLLTFSYMFRESCEHV